MALEPGQITALIRLYVSRFTFPSLRSEEERHAFVARPAVHDMAERELLGINQKTGFFPGLASHGFSCRFASVDVSGYDTVVPVFVAGVFAPEEEHLIVPEKEQMYLWDQFEMLHLSLQCAQRSQ